MSAALGKLLTTQDYFQVGGQLGATALVAPSWAATAANVVLTTLVETSLLLPRIDRRIIWAVPAAHCALSALLGRQLFGQLSWWAWPAGSSRECSCSR